MHFRWLQLLSILSVGVLHHGVNPVMASLEEMDAAGWMEHLKKQPAPDTLFLLYTEKSPECELAEQLIESMIEDGEIERTIPGIKVVKQNKNGALAGGLGIKTFPALVLVRDDITAYYTGRMDDTSEIFFWLDKAGPKAVMKELNEDSFEHLTQASTGSTTGYWLVFFYKKDCMDHFAVLESIAISEKMWINVAHVNLDNNPKLAKRFKIESCSELIYFREGKMYRYETKVYNYQSLISFVTTWFRNVKMSPVPLMPTAFDELTEGIAHYLKEQLEGENRTFTLVVIVGFTVTIAITSFFFCLTGGSDSKQKTE